ncbi:MAG: PspC domain-containing protein [Candidatus Aenigmarchaeota archaeon]|nr:PspC domain-containing protein [Candidatus Aenigmarchaeota archaeon]
MSKKVKRLYRSKNEKVLGGVCAGIGKYFNIDPVIVRLLWILLTFFWGRWFNFIHNSLDNNS